MVRVRVLQARLRLQRVVMIPTTVAQTMSALLPHGLLHLAAAGAAAAASRPLLTLPRTRPTH